MNKITVSGYAVAAPELKEGRDGKETATFNIGVVYGRKPDGKSDSFFMTVILFGNIAKAASRTITKGDLVIVDGKLKIETFKLKNGNNGFAAKLFCNEVYKVDKRQYTSKEQYTEHNNEPDDIPFDEDTFF